MCVNVDLPLTRVEALRISFGIGFGLVEVEK
jgi:hypothetical protein